jgi:hypothetical protein
MEYSRLLGHIKSPASPSKPFCSTLKISHLFDGKLFEKRLVREGELAKYLDTLQQWISTYVAHRAR